MRNKILFRILLFTAFIGIGNSLLAQQIRVLTYNIHHGEDVTGILNLQQIASVINKARPDVVALQEVDSSTKRTNKIDQLRELAALTNMNYFYGKSMAYDGGGYGVGILTKWRVTDSFITRLPSLPNSEPRVLATVVVQLKNKKKFLFTTVHLDHVKNPAERIEQAKKMVEVFSPMKMPSILAGDFNALPEEATMKDVIFNVYEETDPTGQAPSFPSDQPKSKIDYVLVSKKHNWKKVHYEVMDEKVASDHRPVLSVIKLK